MKLIENIIRSDVQVLEAYHVPDATGYVKLDAMENPYVLPDDVQKELAAHLASTSLNRYPVASYRVLKDKISKAFGVPLGFDVILGNGSDELISIISIACAKPGAKVLTPVPGFVMYKICAQLAGLEFVGVPLKADLSLDKVAMLAAIKAHRPAVTYLAYPNNPTGGLFEVADIEEIIRAVGDDGIVIVDEAYQPFSPVSFMSRLPEFPNLVVMRTVSKLGLAGIRLGYMSASKALLDEFDKVRAPYNVNVLTEAAANFLLDRQHVFNEQAALLCSERTRLSKELAALPGVMVFPSAANFLLIRVNSDKYSGTDVYRNLLQRKVLVKNAGTMHPLLQNCLRITISTPVENDIFLDALRASF